MQNASGGDNAVRVGLAGKDRITGNGNAVRVRKSTATQLIVADGGNS